MNNRKQKGRNQTTYNRKVQRIHVWYEHLEKERAKGEVVNPNTKQPVKRKELKPIDYYIEKIKKPSATKGD
jgi:site-specific recombinase XerD